MAASRALTVLIDNGEFKLTLTSSDDQIAVDLMSERNQSLAHYVVPRSAVHRMDLLLAGIDGWARELFRKVCEERGVGASIQQDTISGTD